MPSSVIYSTSTGVISGVITASVEADIAANTPEGSSALAIDADHAARFDQRNWIVVDGVLTAIVPTDAELLAAAQATQNAVIEAGYTSAINNGFTSSALGASHLYPGTPVDQANLTAVITASIIPSQPADWTTLFWCAPVATPADWNYLSHTAAQIQQVGMDAMAYIMAAKIQRATRLGQIQAATTVAAVQAIAW